MNNRTPFALLALLTIVGTLTITSAYAIGDIPEACVGCSMEDAKALAKQSLLAATPISVWTDKTDYGHSDMIIVTGQVANISTGFPVTITVVSPLNSIITIDQVNVAEDGTFGTTLNTAGAIWKYDGTYTIKVNYGSAEKSNSAKVVLTGGVEYIPNYSTPNKIKQCSANELSASDQCIPFSISGGTVTDSVLNINGKSIDISINAEDDGTLTVTPSNEIIRDIFTVLIDGEECDEPECEIVGNKVTIMFPAGAETIEIVGTWIIPEFGTIAVMILAVAIISIIAVSARSRLSIIPRY